MCFYFKLIITNNDNVGKCYFIDNFFPHRVYFLPQLLKSKKWYCEDKFIILRRIPHSTICIVTTHLPPFKNYGKSIKFNFPFLPNNCSQSLKIPAPDPHDFLTV